MASSETLGWNSSDRLDSVEASGTGSGISGSTEHRTNHRINKHVQAAAERIGSLEELLTVAETGDARQADDGDCRDFSIHRERCPPLPRIPLPLSLRISLCKLYCTLGFHFFNRLHGPDHSGK